MFYKRHEHISFKFKHSNRCNAEKKVNELSFKMWKVFHLITNAVNINDGLTSE